MHRRAARLRTLIAALFASAALLAGASATASAATPSAQGLAADPSAWQTSYEIAVRYWGHVPCGGQVGVRWVGLAPNMNALSSWLAVPGAAPSTFADCVVEFNADTEWDFARFCSIAVHEVGHLLGHDHVDDAGHIMAPVTTHIVPECAAARPAPAAPAAPAPAAPAAPVANAPAARTSAAGAARTAKRKTSRTAKRKTSRRMTLAQRRACVRKAKRVRGRAAKARAAKACGAKRKRSAPLRRR